ncbi:MAG: hypothetical protein V1720_07355 [bacterium]
MMITKIKTITVITFLFSIIIFFFTLLDFASLHDIGNDYVSQKILTYLEITPSKTLPDWTKTEGEWSAVTVSLFLRFVFIVLNTSVLYYYFKKILPKINHT